MHFPAQLAMGMMLKLSNNPKQVIREAYQRVEQEFKIETFTWVEEAHRETQGSKTSCKRPTLYLPVMF